MKVSVTTVVIVIVGGAVAFGVAYFAPVFVLRFVSALLLGGLLGLAAMLLQQGAGNVQLTTSDGTPAEFAPFTSMLPDGYRIFGFMNIGARNVRSGSVEVDCWVAMVVQNSDQRLLVGSGGSKLEAMAEIAERLRQGPGARREVMQ